MNTDNSKSNDPYIFRLTLADKLNLTGHTTNMALAK